MPIGPAAYGHAPTRPVLLVQSGACNHRNRTTLTPETDLVSLAGCTVRSTRAGRGGHSEARPPLVLTPRFRNEPSGRMPKPPELLGLP